ncbi:hypothetical protein R1sor_005491 [Riccia sorocarpa]|uniref:Peroxidase n=1 Tax=Riccia sorocarpa TaxID=122646 RepID=A0ABD3HNK1_9MARC
MLTISSANATTYKFGLSENHYATTCRKATNIVLKVVKDIYKSGGCDASALIKSTPGNLAEVDGEPNKNSLEGFEFIDQIKAAVEAVCPRVVSCADITALAARDALLVSRGFFYPVPLGRRDGVVSKASEAEASLSSNTMNYTALVKNFAAQGFTAKDMVTLSGAHTIGSTHCKKIWGRLYNFSATIKTDPALSPVYAAILKKRCPSSHPQSTTDVLLDPTKGGQFFDSQYYRNVLAGRTGMISDSALIQDPAGRSLVRSFASNPSTPFFEEFGKAMVKLGQTKVLTGRKGVIRKVCSRVH